MLEATGPFNSAAFCAEAVAPLEGLELKARVAHVARCLRCYLPGAFPAVLNRLVQSLPPPDPALLGQSWLWPVLQVVEDEGAEFPEASLAALVPLTSRFSGEFAVRPLLARHPGLAYRTLLAWTAHPDAHVRRLASEGSRPRLPWGLRLRGAVADPGSGLRILDALVDDPSEYVRRSVANHLGDVAKDHPARAVALASAWMRERPDRRALVRHALRGPLKSGNTDALALLGNSVGAVAVESLTVTPNPARVGDHVTVSATVRGTGRLRVDLVWQWPGARNGWSSRTFVGKERELADGEAWAFTGGISLRAVTTRPIRVGVQRVFLRVAGLTYGPAEFLLKG